MATVDVIKCCLDSIRQISDNINDAIVYLDAGTSESFQFLGAFPLFLDLGARSVCRLEDMSALDKVVDWKTNPPHVRKIVVMTSCLLSDAHRYILRCLSTLRSVRNCAIYTAISEAAHSTYPDSPLGPDAFYEYESLLNQDYEELVKTHESNPSTSGNSIEEGTEDEGWSQLTSVEDDLRAISGVRLPQEGHSEDADQKLKSSVSHFPLVLCPLSPRVFVLPSEGSVAEATLSSDNETSISYGLPPLSTGKLSDSEDVTPGATLTAQFLYHFALKMDLKLEIFSFGDLSKNVGKLLTDMSSLYDVGRRKRSAGLLLIDRTLDLLTPCCHGDSLLDRMFSSLPRRPRVASATQMKGPKSHPKSGPVKLERAPLAVQVPLEKLIIEEDSKSNFHLLESIEAFLQGWNAIDSNSRNIELMKFSKKLNDESLVQCKESELLHGTLVSTDNFRGAPYLEALLDRRTKDAAMLIKKWLQELLRRENISPDAKIRPGFSKVDLESLVRPLIQRQTSLIKNKGIIQLAVAALHAFDELHSASWDAFSSAEKILHVNAADTSQSLAAQISDLINKTTLAASQVQKQDGREKSRGLFTLHDTLLLTTMAYVLASEKFPTSSSDGPFSWQEEHFMKEAILDAILENPMVSKLKFLQGLSEELQSVLNKTNLADKKKDASQRLDDVYFDDDQWDSWGEEEEDKVTSKEQEYDDMQLKLELRDRVDHFFKFLHKLSRARSSTTIREAMLALDNGHTGDPYASKGLLNKLLTSILDKHDVPGLEYHSSTVGRLFKSGFGRFGLGQAKPSLSEQNVILVFVIGGINGVEVREAQEAVMGSNRPDIELIVGGTTYLTPDNMRELLLGEYCCV